MRLQRWHWGWAIGFLLLGLNLMIVLWPVQQEAYCASFTTLLQYASLRGSHPDRSPIPHRPCAGDRRSRTACLGGFLGWYGYL